MRVGALLAESSPENSEPEDDMADEDTDPEYGFDPCELPQAVRDALNFLDLRFPTGSEAKSSEYCQLFRHLLVQKGALPEMVEQVPRNYQQMETLTQSLLVDMITVHACPKDHLLYRGSYVFEETCPFVTTEGTRCNEPRYRGNSRVPRRAAFYTPLPMWISAVMSVPLFRQAVVDQRYLEGTDGDELRDVFTGRVFQ